MSASSTRGSKNRLKPRIAVKRRRINTSPASGDEAETSPNSLGAIVRKINNSLAELDTLRRKSTNLNGKISGSMRDEIFNIGNFVNAIAKGAETLKSKMDLLAEENRRLREIANPDSVRNSQTDEDIRDFLTPKSSQNATTSMELDQAPINIDVRTNANAVGPEDENFTLVQRKGRPKNIPLSRSYAEMLRVDLPPEILKNRHPRSSAAPLQRQNQEIQRVNTEPPPTAIRVKGVGISYENLVAKIKAGVKPVEHNVIVLSLRKNASQELELRVRGTTDSVASFKSAISTCIGEEGAARKVQPTAFVHIGDLEAEISAEEIIADLSKVVNLEPDEIKVSSLRPAFGNTQKATIKLPRSAALQLQDLARVMIGYVTCRVQMRLFEQRCYRCGENGHLAPVCKGPDKTGQCFRCGSKEHQVRSCPEKPVKPVKAP